MQEVDIKAELQAIVRQGRSDQWLRLAADELLACMPDLENRLSLKVELFEKDGVCGIVFSPRHGNREIAGYTASSKFEPKSFVRFDRLLPHEVVELLTESDFRRHLLDFVKSLLK